jgi:exosome complex component RRP4
MARSHRPGHPTRGREEPSSHPSGDRILVLPGEEVPSRGLKPGPGTYRVGGKIYASVLGLLSERPPDVHVVPLSGRYIPKPGDVVVGTVTDVQSTFWLLDIGAPRWAPLHMTGTPFQVDVGETDRHLHIADAVVVRVENLDPTGRIGVTMLGEGLGRLEGGTIARISAARVPRVVGRGGSMIQTITRATGARVVIGQNGRIWIDGTAEAIQRVTEVLRLIEENGQRPGLTDRVSDYLRESPAPGEEPSVHLPPAPHRVRSPEPETGTEGSSGPDASVDETAEPTPPRSDDY